MERTYMDEANIVLVSEERLAFVHTASPLDSLSVSLIPVVLQCRQISTQSSSPRSVCRHNPRRPLSENQAPATHTLYPLRVSITTERPISAEDLDATGASLVACQGLLTEQGGSRRQRRTSRRWATSWPADVMFMPKLPKLPLPHANSVLIGKRSVGPFLLADCR